MCFPKLLGVFFVEEISKEIANKVQNKMETAVNSMQKARREVKAAKLKADKDQDPCVNVVMVNMKNL